MPAVAAVGGSVASLPFSSTGIYTLGGAPTLTRFFIKSSRVGGETAFISRGDWKVSGATLTINPAKNVRQGDTILALTPVAATFHIPQDCLSWTLQNVSGAAFYFRQYIPNDSGHVIGTEASNFSDTTIVGQKLANGGIVGFGQGEFRPGTKYMLVAASAASAGAIVEFNC